MAVFDIEIVGTCNLSCPSCPSGNFLATELSAEKRPSGLMTIELFREILAKISRELPGKHSISLFNWGEPLLHPRVDEFVAAIKEYPSFMSLVSTNLNAKADLAALVKARPHWMRVSLSGWTQATYERTHRRGNINLVKSNLYRLRYLMDLLDSQFDVEVHYHLYKHNLADAIPTSLAAKELGFAFHPIEAGFMPLEKAIRAVRGEPLSPEDQATIANLLISPRERAHLRRDLDVKDCVLRANQVAINFDGSVTLCCGTYDYANNVAKSFLDQSIVDLQKVRAQHELCKKCFEGKLAIDGYTDPTSAVLKAVVNLRIKELGGQFTY